MVALLSSQPVLSLPPLGEIPDEAEDRPEAGRQLGTLGALQLPRVVFGAGAFSNQYNSDLHLTSAIPLRTVRLALRYGIRAFDTSAYYGPSELVLGNALKALAAEFPRSSYQLMTKCGRYGTDVSQFDYAPATVRSSVERSLQRLQTDYLDTVYLHDVEFVCTPVAPRATGNHASALAEEKAEYGLLEGQEGKIWGPGDRKILDAFAALRQMQEEGLIRNIGITGYPLPTLLRLALLILHTPPYKPVDVILSYSHLSLQNSTFKLFAGPLRERAHVRQLLAASPLSMGLLTQAPPPWHPAPEKLLATVVEARKSWAGDLPSLAVGYSIRNTGEAHGEAPLVVGLSTTREVHECIRAWREVEDGVDEERRRAGEEDVQKIFREAGFLDWSWASP